MVLAWCVDVRVEPRVQDEEIVEWAWGIDDMLRLLTVSFVSASVSVVADIPTYWVDGPGRSGP